MMVSLSLVEIVQTLLKELVHKLINKHLKELKKVNQVKILNKEKINNKSLLTIILK
jgi:hypothetical protein